MKVDKVSYQKTYSIGPYLTDRVGFEATPSNDWVSVGEQLVWETPEMILSNLEKMADEWHKKEHPHLYKDNAPSVGVLFNDAQGRNIGGTISTQTPPIIQVDKEEPDAKSISDQIRECTTMMQLTSYKLLASQNSDYYSIYMDKVKQLANQ